jgi:hypothetical protein
MLDTARLDIVVRDRNRIPVDDCTKLNSWTKPL